MGILRKFAVSIVLLTAFGLLKAEEDIITLDTISNYNGWGWEALVIKNSFITLAIVPEIGGRIMQYDLGIDTFMITNPALYGDDGSSNPWASSFAYGGYKTWPAPQSVWNWPPPPAIDWGHYQYETLHSSADSVTIWLKGPTETIRTPGLRFDRYITAYSNTSRIFIKTVLFNDGSSVQNWGIWEITQTIVRHELKSDYSNFSIYFPVESANQISGNITGYTQAAPGVDRIHYASQEGKIHIDVSDGWTAFVDERDKQSYFKVFDLDPDYNYPSGHSPVEVYTNGNTRYQEQEVVGPLHSINPGDSCIFLEDWYATRAAGPIYKVKKGGMVRHLLKYTADNSSITGEFGVFQKGKTKLRFLDTEGTEISTSVQSDIVPTDSIVLNTTVSLPVGTKFITFSAYDVSDNLIDDLDTVNTTPIVGLDIPSLSETDKIWTNSVIRKGSEIHLYYEMESSAQVKINFIDVNGSVVKNYNNQLNKGKDEITFSSEELHEGVYFIQIIKNDRISVLQLFIQ